MNYNEYMHTLLEQIQNKHARKMVEAELQNHIEDQCVAYEEGGMKHKDALAESVRQMGNPTWIGIELDKIHRPKTPWSLIGIMFLLSLVGVIMQVLLVSEDHYTDCPGSLWGIFQIFLPDFPNDTVAIIVFGLMGFLIAVIVMSADYRFIGRHAKGLYLVYVLGILFVGLVGIADGNQHFVDYLSILFCLIWAGLLYHFRNDGIYGIIQCMIGLAIVLLESRVIFGVTYALGETAAICIFLMLFSILKGVWGREKKKYCIIVASTSFLIVAYIMIIYFTKGIVISQNDLFAPERFLQGFVLKSIFSRFGILGCGLVLLLFAVLIFKILHISFHMSNRIGMLVGTTIGISLLIRIIGCICMNFGIGFYYTTIFPFLGFGFFNSLIHGILMGLCFCIARNRMVMGEE